MNHRCCRGLILLLAVLCLIPGAPVAAQVETGPAVPVPQGHWVYDLLDRAAGAGESGIADGAWLPGHRPTTADAILRALAAMEAEGDARWAGLAASAREWMAAEYGGAEARWGVVPAMEVRGARGAGGEETAVALAPEGYWSPVRGVSIFAVPEVSYGEDGWDGELRRGGVAWQAGNVLLTGSRDNVRYGRAAQGGVVLGEESVLDGLEATLVEPLRPSGFFRWLGAVDGSVHLSRIGEDAFGPTAALLAGEVRVRPHPRVQLEVHRSALVVGTSREGERIGARDIFYLAIGKHSDYEDQIVTAAASVRVTLAEVDVVPYVELGLEDSAGIDEDPGLVLGLQLPALPGVATPVGLRYEYVAFGRDARWVFANACCYSTRNFYRHSFVRSEYRDAGGRLLGHPLGGYGHQHTLEVEASLVVPGTAIRAGAFSREREGPHIDEWEEKPARPNLLYDTFPGRSVGGFAEGVLRRGDLEASIGISGELGDGWDRGEAVLRVRWLGLRP